MGLRKRAPGREPLEWLCTNDLHLVLLNPENLVEYRDVIGKKLKKASVDDAGVVKAMLLLEELGMTVFESNAGRKVYMEISLQV